jgi:SAM-dependent methyltransferase
MHMATSLVETIHNARRFLSGRGIIPDSAQCGGSVLPAKHLRFGGAEFKDDALFLDSGRHEAQRLIEKCGVTSHSCILDIGCGVGRLPIGILSRMEASPEYRGVDVDLCSIEWCRRHITRYHPRFSFERINVLNRRYNPSGLQHCDAFRLPYADHSFDVAYLYSVFSHMMPEDVKTYLAEIRHLLAPTGRVFFTTFVEDGVAEVTENPPGYRREWTGPLHCVRYQKAYLESIIAAAGFAVQAYEYGRETDGQSALYLRFAN